MALTVLKATFNKTAKQKILHTAEENDLFRAEMN
jgi:hypothetical protein